MRWADKLRERGNRRRYSYVRSFGWQWTVFQRTQLDSYTNRPESRDRFAESFNFPLARLSGLTVLDAGCGAGRFAEIALGCGATVICVDLSRAIVAAHANLWEQPKAHFVQADLMRLPFKPRSFDVIYSLGVLHHTPDPRATFHQLVKYLKSSGLITITVYAGYNKLYVRAISFWRQFTRRLPAWMLYLASCLAVPLYYLYRLPGIGLIFQAAVPISIHPDPRWRVLDTFDCYSPTYQSHHTHHEVCGWFVEAGLTDIIALKPGVSFIGRRPNSVGG